MDAPRTSAKVDKLRKAAAAASGAPAFSDGRDMSDSELAAERARQEKNEAIRRRKDDLERKRLELYAWNAALRQQFERQGDRREGEDDGV